MTGSVIEAGLSAVQKFPSAMWRAYPASRGRRPGCVINKALLFVCVVKLPGL